HLVAMGALEPRVAGEVGAAVRVGDDDVVAVRGLLDGGADPLRTVVQLGRNRAHLDVPAAAGGDLLHVDRKGPAGHDNRRPCVPPGRDTVAHPGNASWSMNRSLKSVRPDSST